MSSLLFNIEWYTGKFIDYLGKTILHEVLPLIPVSALVFAVMELLTVH